MVPVAHVLMVHRADGAGTVPMPLGAVEQHISDSRGENPLPFDSRASCKKFYGPVCVGRSLNPQRNCGPMDIGFLR